MDYPFLLLIQSYGQCIDTCNIRFKVRLWKKNDNSPRFLIQILTKPLQDMWYVLQIFH